MLTSKTHESLLIAFVFRKLIVKHLILIKSHHHQHCINLDHDFLLVNIINSKNSWSWNKTNNNTNSQHQNNTNNNKKFQLYGKISDNINNS